MTRRRPEVQKAPLDPGRVRRIPDSGFSWIDRRFVREGFLDRLPPEAALLYFFLVAVSDAHGLSFYADPTIARRLKLTPEELSQSRARLLDAELILYRYPLYQVLPLPETVDACGAVVSPPPGTPRGGDPLSLGEILRRAMASSSEAGNPS